MVSIASQGHRNWFGDQPPEYWWRRPAGAAVTQPPRACRGIAHRRGRALDIAGAENAQVERLNTRQGEGSPSILKAKEISAAILGAAAKADPLGDGGACAARVTARAAARVDRSRESIGGIRVRSMNQREFYRCTPLPRAPHGQSKNAFLVLHAGK